MFLFLFSPFLSTFRLSLTLLLHSLFTPTQYSSFFQLKWSKKNKSTMLTWNSTVLPVLIAFTTKLVFIYKSTAQFFFLFKHIIRCIIYVCIYLLSKYGWRIFLSQTQYPKIFIVYVWDWLEVIIYQTQKCYTYLECLFWICFCASKVSGAAEE